MVCNVQEVPSCPLAHCTQFPAVLSAPSFAWHCLTMWFLICLAPDSAVVLSGLSICDHKGGMKDGCHIALVLLSRSHNAQWHTVPTQQSVTNVVNNGVYVTVYINEYIEPSTLTQIIQRHRAQSRLMTQAPSSSH